MSSDFGFCYNYIIYYIMLIGDIVMKKIYELQYMQVGLKVAYYRKLRGLTQEELAERIEKSPAFIGHIEAPNINKALSLDTLFDISKELDIPAYKFLIFDE